VETHSYEVKEQIKRTSKLKRGTKVVSVTGVGVMSIGHMEAQRIAQHKIIDEFLSAFGRHPDFNRVRITFTHSHLQVNGKLVEQPKEEGE
jgi:hypothetical protein